MALSATIWLLLTTSGLTKNGRSVAKRRLTSNETVTVETQYLVQKIAKMALNDEQLSPMPKLEVEIWRKPHKQTWSSDFLFGFNTMDVSTTVWLLKPTSSLVRFFKMVAATILDFVTFKGWNRQEGQYVSPCQISCRSVKPLLTHSNFSIFQRWRQSTSFGLWYTCLDHPLRAFGGHSAKFGWNWYSSFDNMQVSLFYELGLKMPIHAPKLVSSPKKWTEVHQNRKWSATHQYPLPRQISSLSAKRCTRKGLEIFLHPSCFGSPGGPPGPKFTSLGGDVQQGPLYKLPNFAPFQISADNVHWLWMVWPINKKTQKNSKR